MSRYDIVLYGASGFTGAYILESMVKSAIFKGVSFAVAGRSEDKIRKVLKEVSQKTGIDLSDTPIIKASTDDDNSLAEMCKQAKVLINAVGPYRLHGEAVVRAAVENGANHLDISGEPAYLEKMAAKYNDLAKEKGVYVVGACGWDSIPCDLGIHKLKKDFEGDLYYAETFVQINYGPAGYSFNAGTYQTLILGISEAAKDGLGKIRRAIMPTKLPKGPLRPPKRGQLWKIDQKPVTGWALPFPGADRSIVNRSQYYNYTVNNQRPVLIETYVRVGSFIWALLLALWVVVFALVVQFPIGRKILQKYPDQCSFYLFKNSGPTKEQIEGANFIYWLVGTGFRTSLPANEFHSTPADRREVLSVRGPDAGYIATSGCILSSALAVLRDSQDMPQGGGVYTTAAAFGETNIYKYLESFGITFVHETDVPSHL